MIFLFWGPLDLDCFQLENHPSTNSNSESWPAAATEVTQSRLLLRTPIFVGGFFVASEKKAGHPDDDNNSSSAHFGH